MLKTMLSLRDAERTVHAEVHDGLADIAVAALSAEPTTIEEWHAATVRFVERRVADFMLDQCRAGLAERKVGEGHRVIDMTAKLVVLDTSIGEIPRVGTVQACDETGTLEHWLPYRIADDWQMLATPEGWQQRATVRRAQLEGSWCVDHRKVLYGELPRWLAGQWPQQASTLEEPAQQLQESWLLSARGDLRGRSPRQILLGHQAYVDGDVQDQGQNWNIAGRCPPGLAPDAHAFRYGGFGTHEIILYHEMTLHLLLECERREHHGMCGDLAKETRHLEQLQQEWLHQPHQGLYDQSPAAVIARERARLPAVVPKEHVGEHDDCPICRMMRDSDQPMIWQLDHFALNHCFATSFYPTREQWQTAQEQWEGICQQPETGTRPAPDSDQAPARPEIWQHSYTNMNFFEGMPPFEACAVMLFSIGGHLGELIQDLKPLPEGRDLCQHLHECFDDLRTVIKEQEEVWMVRTASNAFAEALQRVVTANDALTAKCADLEEKLDFLCARYDEHVEPYSSSDPT